GEARLVRLAETLLARPVQDKDVVVGGDQLVGEGAGAVGRVVIGDEDVDGRDRAPDALGDQPDVLRLVVGRDDHEDSTDPRISFRLAHRSSDVNWLCTAARAHGGGARSRGRGLGTRGAVRPRRRRRNGNAPARAMTARTPAATSGQWPERVASVRVPPRRISRTSTPGKLKPAETRT